MALELNEIIQRLERILVSDLGSTFEELRKLLIPQDDAWDSMILMEGRYNDVKIKILRGTLSEDQSALSINKVREDLLHFIQALKEKDIVGYEPQEEPTSYEGHLLYKIPLKMNHKEKYGCLVRIAIEKSAITKYLEMTDEVKQYGLEKVSDVMQVELVDPTMNDAFEINSINEPEQLVLKKGYTEWRFDVTPLKSGVFPLLLKVAVLIMVNGKERKREITLEKEIKVTTQKEALKEELEFTQADVKLNMGVSSGSVVATRGDLETMAMPMERPTMSAAPAPSVPQSNRKSSGFNIRRMASVMSVFLLMAVGLFIFNKEDSGSGTLVTNPNEYSKPTESKLGTPKNKFGSEHDGGQHFANVEVAPIYEEVTRQVPIDIPTRANTTTERVLIPGSDPPRYKDVTKVIENNQQRFREVIDTIEKKPLTIERRRVLGGEKVTPEILKSIQLKLKEAGYDVGKAGDSQSVINEKFKKALLDYQRNNALPVGNLDLETLKELKVSY